ncbi:MAG: anti-repressor SinI family protein [Ectobacillus sp.]
MISQSQATIEKTSDVYLDLEWLELLMEAKKIGLSCEEVRSFLKANASS